jgi:hypothetical protein
MNKQGIFEGHKQILPFLRSPRIVFSNFEKRIGARNGPIGINSSHGEPIGNNEDQVQEINLNK